MVDEEIRNARGHRRLRTCPVCKKDDIKNLPRHMRRNCPDQDNQIKD